MRGEWMTGEEDRKQAREGRREGGREVCIRFLPIIPFSSPPCCCCRKEDTEEEAEVEEEDEGGREEEAMCCWTAEAP
jgi:hypothetical protein